MGGAALTRAAICGALILSLRPDIMEGDLIHDLGFPVEETVILLAF